LEGRALRGRTTALHLTTLCPAESWYGAAEAAPSKLARQTGTEAGATRIWRATAFSPPS